MAALGDGDDPRRRAASFYQKLRELNLPLISHAGEESRGAWARSANTSRQRRFVACARALDAGSEWCRALRLARARPRPRPAADATVESFAPFERMMGEGLYEHTLIADISANDAGEPGGPRNLARVDSSARSGTRAHQRLDYPLALRDAESFSEAITSCRSAWWRRRLRRS
jgi:hypothetical protein